MTRSGLASATLWATCPNGQSAGLLQSWNLPLSSSSAALALLVAAFAALDRPPVSPHSAIADQGGLGKGERRILDACRGGAGGDRQFADQDRERRVGQGANVHRPLRSVDSDGRTAARLREHRACHGTLRTE